ncbi:MAG: peptidoglycan-associated lipoprotein Pal [Terricaulis sp.]
MQNKIRSISVAIATLAAVACAHRGTSAPTDATSTTSGAAQSQTSQAFSQEAEDRVYFEYDQATLTVTARETLQRQAAWLTRNGATRAVIAGNCDERGTREYNIALGARRAAAVRDYLISLGVNGDRIETVSYGKDRPIDNRPSETGWAVNRNAQTTVSGALTG